MYRSGCPLASALDIIGDKWSLVIIRDLFLERSTFKAFLAAALLPPPTQAIVIL